MIDAAIWRTMLVINGTAVKVLKGIAAAVSYVSKANFDDY